MEKLKKILLIMLAVVILFPGISGEEKEETMTFDKIKRKTAKLYRQKKFTDAAKLYEEALPRFPGEVYHITFSLGQLYMQTGEYEKSLAAFEYGLERNVPYPFWPGHAFWQPLEKFERFKKILAENSRLRASLTAKTKPQFNASTPASFSPKKKYPLLIVLHGWNEALPDLGKHWRCNLVKREFILVLAQSSQVISPGKFGWDDVKLNRKDIKEILEKLMGKYPVDKKKIIFGGFSQGGMAALDTAVNSVPEAAGFVALQPGGKIPVDLNAASLRLAGQRGLSGTIILPAPEQQHEEHTTLVKILQEAKFEYRSLISGSGHWYSADFKKRLGEALVHIFDKKYPQP